MRVAWLLYSTIWTAAFLASVTWVIGSFGIEAQFAINAFAGALFVIGLWGFTLRVRVGPRKFWLAFAILVGASFFWDLVNLYQVLENGPSAVSSFLGPSVDKDGLLLVNPFVDQVLALPGLWAVYMYPFKAWSEKSG